ncbi:ATP-binding protein [bacterium]|nr:ATP-binding protein [bacterium]
MKNKKTKIAVVSGKGGVGKSMVASTLAMLFSQRKKVTAIDCDVDTPNLDIWLGEPGKWEKRKKLSLTKKPIIDNNKITKDEAKECVKKCHFNALEIKNGKLKLNRFLCEGCGACKFFCPKNAIKMEPVKNAEIKIKSLKRKFIKIDDKTIKINEILLISGQIYPGETGSGKIVDEIKIEADKYDADFQILDSAPGTGCPVIASIKDVNFSILVTEPTLSGFSDLKKVFKLTRCFNIPSGLIINKWDIDKNLTKKIKNWISKKNGLFLGRISYNQKIFQAISNLTPIIDTDLKTKKEIKMIFNRLKNLWHLEI